MAEKFNKGKDININISEGTTEEIIEMVLKEEINCGVICVNEHDLAYYRKLLILNNLDFTTKKAFRALAFFYKIVYNKYGNYFILVKSDNFV